MEKKLYQMNTEVIVLEEFILREEINSDIAGIILKKGERVTIGETDNKSWCSVVNNIGEVGWFKVQKYNFIEGINKRADKVFDGLDYSD